MSLRDTIEGALQEAEGNAVGRPKKEAEAVSSEEKKGFVRSSVTKARPKAAGFCGFPSGNRAGISQGRRRSTGL